MNTVKNIVISAVIATVVSLLVVFVSGLVGNQSADILGVANGITRMPNSGMVMHYLKLTNSPATSTSISDQSLLVMGTSTLTGATNIAGNLTLTGQFKVATASSTIGCLHVYQNGATTVASTTYYLVASTTVTNDGYNIFATSTKPTYCD